MSGLTDLVRTDRVLDALGARRPGGLADDPLVRALLTFALEVDAGDRGPVTTGHRPSVARTAFVRPAGPHPGTRRPGGRRRWLGGGTLAAVLVAGSSIAAAFTGTEEPDRGATAVVSAPSDGSSALGRPLARTLAPLSAPWSFLPVDQGVVDAPLAGRAGEAPLAGRAGDAGEAPLAGGALEGRRLSVELGLDLGRQAPPSGPEADPAAGPADEPVIASAPTEVPVRPVVPAADAVEATPTPPTPPRTWPETTVSS
ncbi:MAG TPA: hypothetical protein VLO09_05555, partial [Ornithinimicrobium sp.]|nr:hypothetical protein [Ornithinimicrobium sp.]